MRHWTFRYALSLVLISLIFLAWYMFVYQSISGWQTYYVAHYTQRVKQRKLLPTITKRIALLSQQKNRIQTAYERIFSQCDTLCHTRLLEVSRAISQYGMQIHKAFGNMCNISSGYSFTFYGTPQQIHSFFEIFFHDTLCICSHVVLSNHNEFNFECTCVLQNYHVNSVNKKALQLKKAEGLGG
jgi:hypothetical protein